MVMNFSSVGWAFVCSIFLWFMLVFTGKTALLKKKWLYFFLLGVPSIFVYKQWANSLFVDYDKWYCGWVGVFDQNSHWPLLFTFYTVIYSLIGLIILSRLIRKTQDKIIKKQSTLIFITTIISLVLTGTLDLIMPLFNFQVVPDFGSLLVIFLAAGITLAIIKYNFLVITPAVAAENIISTISDLLIMLNGDGKITRVNNAISEILGYKEAELVGNPINILFFGDDSTEEVTREITTHNNLKNKELAFKTRGGEKVHVLFSSSLMVDKSGTIIGVVCAARDISKRKKLEEENLKIKKLESIGILAGGIAHDFNNLLSVITGNISLALDERSSRDEIRKFLRESEKAALKASELAMKFLVFSEGGWLKKDEIVLPGLIEDVKNTLTPGNNYVYDLHIPPNIPPIMGDEDHLKEVLKNIFINAVEAMPQGGSITVQVEDVELETGNIFLLHEGQYVKISISDTGSGIPEADLEKIFDPYFSTKNNVTQKGLGLGLSVCYSIIKKHDGHIYAESKPGKSTTIILYLPVLMPPDINQSPSTA